MLEDPLTLTLSPEDGGEGTRRGFRVLLGIRTVVAVPILTSKRFVRDACRRAVFGGESSAGPQGSLDEYAQERL